MPEQSKFENMDLFASLEAIMKQNTGFYQSDLEIDKEIIAKAAASPRKEDKTFLWFCRPSGTHCFRERIVFLKGTAPHNTWRLYKRPRLAYAIELTGEERGKIKGKEWIFPSPFSANSRQSPERPPAAVFIRTSGPGAAPPVDELNDLPDLLTALQ